MIKRKRLKILVLDGRSRATITIVRSLGLLGYEVHVGEEFRPFSWWSKYCTKFIKYPSAKYYSKDFKEYILYLAQKEKYDAIIPVRDDTTKSLIEIKTDPIIKYKIKLPDYINYINALNKSFTIKRCQKLEIPHPKTIITDDYNNKTKEIISVVKNELCLPIIIKPSISSGSRGIYKIDNWDNFAEKLNNMFDNYSTGLIQEFIPYGGSYGVEFLYDNGRIKSQFTHKRLREYPINGGPSTYRKATKYPLIESYSKLLLDSFSWNGVAMVEYRIDSRSKKPILMEINPRFWGSLAMAYYSGVDFPKLLVDLIINGECEEIFDYNLDMKTRWLLFGDLLWFLSAKKSKHNIIEFFRFKEKNLKYDIISLNDPSPVIGIIVDAFRTIFDPKKLKHIFNRGWESNI